MIWARNLAIFVILLMAVLMANILINDSFLTGIGMDRFIDGLHDPWRTFIGFDMMTGLFLMFGWILYRQKGQRPLDALAWVLLGNWWGNIVIGAYILVALGQSQGDAARFFMGQRAGILRSIWNPSPLLRGLCLAGVAGTILYAFTSMQKLAFAGLPAWAFVPAFAPVALGFMLLAFPAGRRA